MDVLKSEAGEFLLKPSGKGDSMSSKSFTVCFFKSPTRVVNCTCDCIHSETFN